MQRTLADINLNDKRHIASLLRAANQVGAPSSGKPACSLRLI